MDAHLPSRWTAWSAAFHAGFDTRVLRLASAWGRLYREGFGRDPEGMVARACALADEPVRPLRVAWEAPVRRFGVEVRRGSFRSPVADLLPEEARRGVVERWLPHPRAPTVVLLAATAEVGFATRCPLALALARCGIGSILLENPLYGARRPAGQVGAEIRTVSEQVAMNLATAAEAAGLLAMLAERGVRAGVSGFSQGGVIAAFVAGMVGFPVVAVPRGAPCDPSRVLLDGPLSCCLQWEVLGEEAGGVVKARERLARLFAPLRLDLHPPPRDPTRAVVVACRHDAVVTAEQAAALHAHWRGSELRWVDAGHTAAFFTDFPVAADALACAFGVERPEPHVAPVLAVG